MELSPEQIIKLQKLNLDIDKLTAINTIKVGLEIENTLLDKKEKEFNLYKQQYKKNIIEIQSKCKHQLTKYVPDASGNNDSYTYCEICGKEL